MAGIYTIGGHLAIEGKDGCVDLFDKKGRRVVLVKTDRYGNTEVLNRKTLKSIKGAFFNKNTRFMLEKNASELPVAHHGPKKQAHNVRPTKDNWNIHYTIYEITPPQCAEYPNGETRIASQNFIQMIPHPQNPEMAQSSISARLISRLRFLGGVAALRVVRESDKKYVAYKYCPHTQDFTAKKYEFLFAKPLLKEYNPTLLPVSAPIEPEPAALPSPTAEIIPITAAEPAPVDYTEDRKMVEDRILEEKVAQIIANMRISDLLQFMAKQNNVA